VAPVPKEAQRAANQLLFRGRWLLPVLFDAQPPDLRFQRLSWYPEFRSRSGRSGYPPMGLGEGSLDHFHFTIIQYRKAFVRR
jgi:hypothetical protein